MKRLLFASLVGVALLLVLLPIGEARRPDRAPNGPTREGASAPSKKKAPSEKKKSAEAKTSAAAQESSPAPIFAQAVGSAESAPASTLPATGLASDPGLGGDIEAHEINELNTRSVRANLSGPSFDAALQTSLKSKSVQVSVPALPTPLLTFEGISEADGNPVAPPDTNGDVGPNDYVQAVNNMIRVFDKSGVPRGPGFRQSGLFANLGGICAASDKGDPVVLYDRLANRWLLSQFAFNLTSMGGIGPPPYHECVAISRTPDPTGSYFVYDFQLPGTEFPDYPKFGAWPDGYYMTTNQFNNAGPFDGAGAFAFDRQKMLVGDPTAGLIYFNLNLTTHPEGIFGMLPSDHDGLLPPPAGAPNVFIYFTNTLFADPADGLRLFNFQADFATPALSTFAETQTTYATPLALAAFDGRDPGGRGDIEQPPPAGNNSTDRLDSVASRLMFRLQYQNRNGVEALVSNFTVNVSGVAPNSAANYQAGFRYFELQRNNPLNPYTVTEQATFAPGAGNGATGDNRWMGSAAADNQDNLAVGYSISGVTAGHFPSLNYAARAFTDPPNGLFQGEGTLFAGTGVQRGTVNRWGDYSAMQIDPSDDCSFWFTSEYYTSTTLTFNWRTRIGKFKVPTCTAPQQGTLAGTVTACDTGQPLQDALVQVSGGPSNGFSTTTLANGTYSMNLAPGTYTVTITDTVHNCSSTSTFNNTVINNGATTTVDACLTGSPTLVFQSAAVSGGNGNGVIDVNECNNLNVTIQNIGCLKATAISAVLSSSTTGVTITQPNSPYPDINENASGTNIVPFSVSTSNSIVCGAPINFTLTVTTAQGVFPINFSMPTCTAANQTVNGSLDPADPDTTAGRLGRNAIVSTCAGKICPGALGAGGRSYDAITFTNPGDVSACVTATLTSAGGVNLIAASYLGTFNPADTTFCSNYLGDPGGSANGSVSWSFTVPAGQNFQVVVMEVNAGTASTPYSVTVSGLLARNDGGGVCQACSITCPANITQPNDPGQCGAIVNYPAPSSAGTCGVVTCSPASGSFFPVGTTTVTCSTTAGPSCSFNVTVNDTQPPSVSPITVASSSLWPPNHDLINVGLAGGSFSDNCHGATRQVLVFGDEDDETPTGDGNFSPDAKDLNIGTLRLRSERKGDADGRVYLIVVKVTDAAGNMSFRCATVVVTHDQSKASIASVNAQAAAARAYCDSHGGAPPPGYFVIGDGPIIGPKQ
jgi:uncharacterized membrane protein